MKGICSVKDDYVKTFNTDDGNCYLLLEKNIEFEFEYTELDKVIVKNKNLNLLISKDNFDKLFEISNK